MGNLGTALFIVKSLVGEFSGARNLRAIEVGPSHLYGGNRPTAELHGGFDEYIGIDIREGPNVDVVCDAQDVVERFGRESFDVVIADEVIEHVRDWRKVVSNLKNVCKPMGILIITTRSRGYGYHAAPYDFWRYEAEDIKDIFSDCEIVLLEKDLEEPGVFVKVRKPVEFAEKDLSDYRLFSIVGNRRVKDLDDRELHKAGHVFRMMKAMLRGFGRQLFSYSKMDFEGMFKALVREIVNLLQSFRRE